MKKQWQLLLTALMFYTRLPISINIRYHSDMLSKATRYLPLIGWLTGGLMIVILYTFNSIAPFRVSLLLSIIAGIWITGAFHEDGLADMCDGFGGGWTKEKILNIMKDSHIGTYGTLGLLTIMLLKFFSLSELPLKQVIMAITAAQPMSRFMAVSVVYTHTYAREIDNSKAKPVSKGITLPDLFIAAIWGLLPFTLVMMFLRNYTLLLTIPALLLIRWYMARLMRKWIGGYTGDCLGAVQQVSETVIYLCFCILTWKYT